MNNIIVILTISAMLSMGCLIVNKTSNQSSKPGISINALPDPPEPEPKPYPTK